MMRLSVVIPTHNPHPGRLARTLQGLRAQTLPGNSWELLVVDNASQPPVRLEPGAPGRTVAEAQLGLTPARRRGLREARGEFIVLVDDDNVLAPDYLERTVRLFDDHPRLGALGGRSLPEFEQPPPDWWSDELGSLIACRDLGQEPRIAVAPRPADASSMDYPACAPIGAGMALRRAAVEAWAAACPADGLTDRRGADLSSGGDNDIVLSVLRAGWDVGYSPGLRLTHLIPAARLQPAYLARLNRAMSRSWIRVLRKHHACPWGPIARWTVPLRQARAWFTHRAWDGPVGHIRWQGACGHFEGRAESPAN